MQTFIEKAVSRYRECLRDYFADTTVQGRIQKRGRFTEAEWWLKNVCGMTDEYVRSIYDEEYEASCRLQM